MVTYNTLVDAYVKAGWHGAARAALEDARRAGVPLDAWSFSPLVKGCCRSGDLAAALGVLDEMRAAGVAPNVVRPCARGRAPGQALGVPTRLARTESSRGACALLHNKCMTVPRTTPPSTGPRYHRASEPWTALGCTVTHCEQSTPQSHPSQYPAMNPSLLWGQVIWATLVDGAVRAGDLGAGEALLARMRSAGCAPNDYIFNSLLRGVCSRGGPPEARPAAPRPVGAPCARHVRLCLHPLGAPGGVTPYKYPNPPHPAHWLLRPPERLHRRCDVLGAPGDRGAHHARGSPVTLTATLTHCLCQDALRLLRDMRGAGVAPTAVTFNTLMDACLARGAPAAVPRMFRALLPARLAPDAASYTTLVAAFARLGRPDDAVRARRCGLSGGAAARPIAGASRLDRREVCRRCSAIILSETYRPRIYTGKVLGDGAQPLCGLERGGGFAAAERHKPVPSLW